MKKAEHVRHVNNHKTRIDAHVRNQTRSRKVNDNLAKEVEPLKHELKGIKLERDKQSKEIGDLKNQYDLPRYSTSRE